MKIHTVYTYAHIERERERARARARESEKKNASKQRVRKKCDELLVGSASRPTLPLHTLDNCLHSDAIANICTYTHIYR